MHLVPVLQHGEEPGMVDRYMRARSPGGLATNEKKEISNNMSKLSVSPSRKTPVTVSPIFPSSRLLDM